MSKAVCDERKCRWHGPLSKCLTAQNPFEKDEIIHGCPECKTVESIRCACEHPGCWEPVTCGTPTRDGYKNTCGDHAPEISWRN